MLMDIVLVLSSIIVACFALVAFAMFIYQVLDFTKTNQRRQPAENTPASRDTPAAENPVAVSRLPPVEPEDYSPATTTV